MNVQRTPACTFSGEPVFYAEPKCTTIFERDLYEQLKAMPRYGCTIKVTVLEHLALCTRIAKKWGYGPVPTALCAGHDLAEAYLLDIPRGLKELLGSVYSNLEDPWQRHILISIGLQAPDDDDWDPSMWYPVDEMALLVEMTFCRHPLRHLVEELLGQACPPGLLSEFESVKANTDRSNWTTVWTAVQAGVEALKEAS